MKSSHVGELAKQFKCSGELRVGTHTIKSARGGDHHEPFLDTSTAGLDLLLFGVRAGLPPNRLRGARFSPGDPALRCIHKTLS